ncbi:hypothetical protein HY990_07315 [Candidatus Micrarchaeota archaeon]|nr:hypothetical protein [Candidatus Micrarchaeota archaeon]
MKNLLFMILAFVLLLGGNVVFAAPAPNTTIYLSCSDSDGGLTTGVHGRINYTYNTAGFSTTVLTPDFCRDSKTVVEHYCLVNLPAGTDITCGTGFTCRDGACVKAASEETKTPLCKDSDGGNYDYAKGTITLYSDSSEGTLSFTASDSCVEGKLHEYYCTQNNTVEDIQVSCPGGFSCSDGACVVRPASKSDSCTVNADGSVTSFRDGAKSTDSKHCLNSEALVDFGCNGTRRTTWTTSCSSGMMCQDGQCVQKPESSSPTCKYTEGGNDIHVKGTLSVSTPDWGVQTVSDYCVDSNGQRMENGAYVEKLVCISGDPKYAYKHERVQCPSGYSCNDGACVVSKSSTKADDDSCNGFTCYAGTRCDDNTCIHDASDSCASDGNNGIVYVTNGKTSKLPSYCSDQTAVTYACVGKNWVVQTTVCPDTYSCSGGKCVAKNPPPAPPASDVTLALVSGWNLLSSPFSAFKVTQNTCGNSIAYRYDASSNGYKTVDLSVGSHSTLDGDGFWLRVSSGCELVLTGDVNSKISDLEGKKLSAGWNMVGAASESSSWQEVKGTCASSSGPWSFDASNNKWVKASSLETGHGYFVKVERECHLGSGSMPPLPPS